MIATAKNTNKEEILGKLKDMNEQLNNFTKYKFMSKETAEMLGVKNGMIIDNSKIKIIKNISYATVIDVDKNFYDNF